MAGGKAKRARLVIVDDDSRYLRTVRRVVWTLAKQVDVTVYHSGEEALQPLLADPPELVVLDVRMPGLDGIELCRRLKAAGAPYVVLVSGYMAPEVSARAYAAGADLALPKPYDLATVLSTRFDIGDAPARTSELVASEHLVMAQNIARSLARRYRELLSVRDIEGLALLGLCEAARRYNPHRNGLFFAFAATRIRGAVLDEVRRISAARAAQVFAEGSVTLPRTLEAVASEDPLPDNELAQVEMRAAVEYAREHLAKDEAEVLCLHYDCGLSFTAIAQRMGLAKSRVVQIHARSLERLRADAMREGGKNVRPRPAGPRRGR